MPALTQTTNYLPEVRNQYENYPYPYRDPQKEKYELHFTGLDALSHINHFGFEGKKDFSKGIRALVAGGGTGDGVIALAEQLRDTPSQVIYMDISQASMDVAKARAEIRGLSNIQWIHGSLLDAPSLGIGTFDYINSSGVLHHLENPSEGLAALEAVLDKNGVMGLMLYAPYGRAGIYQMQDIMRLLNRNEPDMQQRVDNCKPIIEKLQAGWMQYIRTRYNDIALFGDIGIYDMFLHSQDRAYSIPELYTFLSTSNLHLQHLCAEPRNEGHRRYRPEYYIDDARFHALLSTLCTPEKQALAEMLNGTIFKHAFLATKKPKKLPDFKNTDMIPFVAQFFEHTLYADLHRVVSELPSDKPISLTLTVAGFKNNVILARTPHVTAFFEHMNGMRTLGIICKRIQNAYGSAKKPPSIESLVAEFQPIYEAFAMQDCMFLRHKSVPAFKTTGEMQQPISDIYTV